MGRVLVFLLPIALTIFALVDCIQTDDEHVRGIPKFGWIVLIVLIWVVGPIAWLIAGKDRRARAAARGTLPFGGRTQPPARQVAPDDDPEFLRQLNVGNAEHERMLKQWEEDLRRRERDMNDPDGTDGGSAGKS